MTQQYSLAGKPYNYVVYQSFIVNTFCQNISHDNLRYQLPSGIDSNNTMTLK